MLSVSINSFSYGETDVLSNVNFKLETGKHLSILGESGCGKSTLLHLIYGLLHVEDGSLSWENTPMLGPKFNLVPGEPFIKLVAQEFDLMPHTTVADNIATHLPRTDLKSESERVAELIEVVGMSGFKNTKVKTLSGGQKQRVALAKALALTPKLLLLDEPFSHIDNFRKNTLRRRLYAYLKKNNISCITATHNSQEALAFSDEIIILKDGAIELTGNPEEIYQAAKTPYQLSFFGELTRLEGEKPSYVLPHQLQPSEIPTPLEVRVEQNYFMGTHYLVCAQNQGGEVLFQSDKKNSSGDYCVFSAIIIF